MADESNKTDLDRARELLQQASDAVSNDLEDAQAYRLIAESYLHAWEVRPRERLTPGHAD